MLGWATITRYWYWAALALVSALIAVAALVAPGRISVMELEREALTAATRIRAQALEEPEYLYNAFSKPAHAPRLNELFDRAGYNQRVLRYELYDAQGNLTFTSGQSGLRVAEDAIERVGTRTAVQLLEAESKAGEAQVALLTLPISFSGAPRGTLQVYLDQSAHARIMFDYFGLIVAVTVILLAIGIATPAVVAFMRSQERRRAEAQVRYLENYDTLTGLPNRRAFIERLTDAMVRMHRDSSSIAVVCLDIDKFKEINDASDHSGGDAVLREVGSRIQSTLRDGDIIARLGADEFAIALVDITNLGDVMAFMNRLVEALRRPLQIAGKEVMCTTSVGIALAPADGENAAAILRHAAIALARAKSDGGQRMCFFEESMDKALQRRRMVEHELRLALSREEFDVVYQPQFNLAAETQCGAEALIRWNHPVHGRIAPGHFISVAEDTGLIVPLGEWVLRRACSDAAQWPGDLTIAVNLSPAQFRDGDIAETVAQVLHDAGLEPHRLELEITENLLMQDTEEVLRKLNRLGELGVAIAMDDFGTGYSSLSYLARFPFNKIKIDRQFIRNMPRDPATKAIVKTIIALGRSLDVIITAEGVETEEQAAMLRDFGCPQVQGFLYGYPAASFEASPQPRDKVTTLKQKRRSSAA